MTIAQDPPTGPVKSAPDRCPPWCGVKHSAGSGAHFSPQSILPNPRPLPGETPALLRAELYQDALGGTQLFLQGETTVDLSPVEADVLIAQAQGFVDTLRILRQQMH